MNVKTLAMIATAAACGAACATDYEWVGGASASASWSDPANWSPSTGSPGAGDTAYFPVSATITGGFEIGEGTLCITNVPGSVLELKGVITGEGGIVKKGRGTIALYGANTFSGGFTAGSADGEEVKEPYGGVDISCNNGCGIVALHNGSGFGTSKAYVYSSLYIAATEDMEITSPIEKGWGKGELRVAGGGNVVFLETVDFVSDCPYCLQDGTEVRYRKKVTSGSGWHSNRGGAGTTIVFESDFYGPASFLTFSNSELHFHGTRNVFHYLYINTPVHFHSENSVSSITRLSFDTERAVLDLCGVDQTFSNGCEIAFTTDDVAGYEIRSSTPARLVLKSDIRSLSGTFRGRFTGCAGLSLSADAAKAAGKVFTISDFVQPTCGTFTIGAQSSLVLKNGAGFAFLSGLELKKDNGGFYIQNSASDVMVGNLDVRYRWCHLEVGEGRKLECRVATFENSQISEDGAYAYVYGKGDAFRADENGGIVVNSAMPHHYVGADGGDWDDPANWSPASLPQDGDNLRVVHRSVAVSSPTPVLGNVDLEDGGIVFKGWNAKLSAADLTVGPGAVITSDGPFTNETDRSRVWISCGDLTVAEGGKIDVTKKGWSCGVETDSDGYACGYGPAGGMRQAGASHGGLGGKVPNPCDTRPEHLACYGSESQPETHGSGGFQRLSTTGNKCTDTHGGGVVRIESTGTVTVNGEILANGGSVVQAGTVAANDRQDTAGAGGSIWITCARIAGDGGVIEAKGGDGDEPCYPRWKWSVAGNGKPGGGGRIAIDYGETQQASDLTAMTVSACAGLYTGTSGYFTGAMSTGAVLPLALQDRFRNSAELGSVWFTDTKLLDALVGAGLYGYIAHPLGYCTQKDLSFTRGWVRFRGEGADVSIGGDLEITGDSRLEVGGVCYTNRFQDVSMAGVYGGDEVVRFTVAGNMTVTDGGRFDIRPAGTAGEDGWGALVSVSGNLLVGANGHVVPWCDLFSGTAAKFSVGGDFTVGTGGEVYADGLGFAGGLNWGGYPMTVTGYGPGGGFRCGAGGHGGAGGIGWHGKVHEGSVGASYGDEYVPVLPGSGGGDYGYGLAGNGGGVVYVEAGGTLRVDGTISADGMEAPREDTYLSWNASGAGGSVCLRGRSMSGTGVISADGGDGRMAINVRNGVETLSVAAGGGGGRVSVWTGLAVVPGADPTVFHSVVPSESRGVTFTGEISAAGGGKCLAYNATGDILAIPMPETAFGGDGTVRYSYARKVGFSVTVR